MSVVLALSAAMVYGSADFLGGLASRRRAALPVAFGAQIAGLVLLLTALSVVGTAGATRTDVVAGAVGGIFSGFGLVLLYRTLARGPMSVVAPVTALTASAVPILAGLATGERPGPAALLGIAVALASVVLITREGPTDPDATHRASADVVGASLLAGALFGLFFVCLHHTGDDAGLVPLLGARLTSVPLLGLLLAARREDVRTAFRGRAAAVIVASGVLDMAANVLYLVALRHGLLAVVSAITGLYPAATVILAQTVLSERMRRTQVSGLGIAVVAAGMIALT